VNWTEFTQDIGLKMKNLVWWASSTRMRMTSTLCRITILGSFGDLKVEKCTADPHDGRAREKVVKAEADHASAEETAKVRADGVITQMRSVMRNPIGGLMKIMKKNGQPTMAIAKARVREKEKARVKAKAKAKAKAREKVRKERVTLIKEKEKMRVTQEKPMPPMRTQFIIMRANHGKKARNGTRKPAGRQANKLEMMPDGNRHHGTNPNSGLKVGMLLLLFAA